MVEVAVGSLLPHGPKARFLDRVTGWSEGSLEGVGRVPPGSAYEEGERCSPVVCVELGAQAAAALEALQRLARGETGGAREGYLVTVQDARFAAAGIEVDTDLNVVVRRLGTAGPLARYEAVVSCRGVECAAVSMSTFLASKPTA